MLTQFDMDGIEKIGLVKFDFLGLITLTVIQDAERLISARQPAGEPPFSVSAVPLDDPATFKLLAAGRTAGVFQFESSGMRDTVVKMRPDKLDDLIALNALYRPGPLEAGVVALYLDRRHGKQAVQYRHPVLKEALEPTYGLPVYQEQVMQIAADARRLHAVRSRRPAQGDGQEEGRGHGRPAREVRHGRRREAQGPRRPRRGDLRRDREVRRLRLQQVAQRGVRADRLPHRLAQDAPPGGVHGGAADERGGGHRPDRQVHRRVPRDGAQGAPARRQRLGAQLHRGRGLDPLRARGGEERRRGGDRVDRRGARRARALHVALRLLLPHRPAPGEQARARGAGQVRRARLRGGPPRPDDGGARPGDRGRAGHPARPQRRAGQPVRRRRPAG